MKSLEWKIQKNVLGEKHGKKEGRKKEKTKKTAFFRGKMVLPLPRGFNAIWWGSVL